MAFDESGSGRTIKNSDCAFPVTAVACFDRHFIVTKSLIKIINVNVVLFPLIL